MKNAVNSREQARTVLELLSAVTEETGVDLVSAAAFDALAVMMAGHEPTPEQREVLMTLAARLRGVLDRYDGEAARV